MLQMQQDGNIQIEERVSIVEQQTYEMRVQAVCEEQSAVLIHTLNSHIALIT